MGVATANWTRAIKRDHREGSSDSTNKRVNRWIKSVTGDDSHSAHWIRHTVVTKLETVGVPEQFVRVLVGHAAQRDAHSVYSHLLKQVKELKVAMNRLDYSEAAA
jgi:intergrase/recombinase